MSCVAKVEAGLVGALVGTVLQVDDTFASAQLFIGELASVLVGHFRSKDWAFKFGVDLGRSAKGENALRHLGNISSFPQVYGLEDIDFWYAIRLAALLEFIDVLHQLELSAAGVYFSDGPGDEFIHKSA